MIIDLNYRVDILKGIVSQNAEHPLYYDDQNAHRVNVSLYRGQEEIDLSGLSCNGYVVFVKEGASIGPLTGEVSNNTCSVVLPHEAYQHPGAIRVEIKLIEGDSVTTVLMLTGHVSSGRGDRVIDITGSIVPSLDSLKATIEELESRIAAIEVSDIVELEGKVVRHDTAQSLTDAQQAQARGNIGIDGAVNFAEQGSTQSVTAYGVTATRTGNRVTLNGTTTYNGALRFRMGGSLTSRAGTPTAAQNAAAFGAVTVSGRIYVCEVRLISGTATGGANESPMYVTPMKAGTTGAHIGSNLRRSDYYSRAFVSDGTGAVLWIGADPGTSFTDAVFEVTFRDATVATQENENIAPADAPVATATHAAGSMLTVGGQLYKATQTIVAGETITPGTNVTTTTVAAQLAERDTAIAAVSSAAMAGVLAALDAQAAIDFGWVAGDQTATGAGITAVRNGNRITLNGTATSGLSSAQRFRMMGNLVTVNGSPTAAQNVSGAVLTNGHRYMTVMRLVSGTAVYSGDGTGFLTLAPYKSGSTSVYFNEVITSDDYTYYMRGGYADGSPLTLWVSFRSGWAFTNATYEVSVYDMTAKAWQSLPTTPTTDGTYTLKVTVTNGVPAYSWAAN